MSPPSKRNIGLTGSCTNPNGCISNEKRSDLFLYVRWLLFFSAIRPIPFDKHLPRRMHGHSVLVNVIWEIFLYLVVLHILVLFIITIYLNYDNGDLEFLISCGIQVLIYLWAILIKVTFRRIYPELVNGIVDFVNEEYVQHSALGFTYVTMKECVDRVNGGIRIFVPCCFSAVIYRFILPIIYNDRSLPLPCWYPVNYKAPFIFQILYFFQILAQLQMSAAFTVSSVYFISLCFLLSGQFDVLNCSLKNIVATTYIYMGASKHELIELRDNERIPGEEINEFFVAKELPFDLDCLPHILNPADTARTRSFREAFNYALGSCVKQHNFILNALLKLERLYNLLWLFKTLDVTLSICMGTFDVVKSSDEKSFLQLLSLGQYLFLGLWEIFMICYAGEIIYVNSQRCDEALLRSPWHLHLREVRADFLLFLMNAQRAFKLTGGKFYPLALEKFRGIVSTSFSFYTLLQNLDERN
ncbi:odorant receptor 83a-like [Zeugodacus cucurbitae]|uniref:odorant receptor 83a-like n=1 Tax=Zeugodacus cucurbitae TaxID=28588 RepID=UPI0005969BAF|nr:odorant receptor 83a-like [Zeugodacus cucurbitae]